MTVCNFWERNAGFDFKDDLGHAKDLFGRKPRSVLHPLCAGRCLEMGARVIGSPELFIAALLS